MALPDAAARDPIFERLRRVFGEVLANPGLELSAESTPETVPGWDSMAHLNLVLAIEQEFAVRFTTQEIGALASVGDFRQALASRAGQNSSAG